MNDSRTLTDSEVQVNGIEALNRALGVAGAFRFLTLIRREPTDYVQISRRLYAGQSVDEIMDRAGRQWDKAG